MRVARLSALAAFAATGLGGLAPGSAGAVEIRATNAWVQSAREAQQTSAYMDLRADGALQLVRAESPWASRVEIRTGAGGPNGASALPGPEELRAAGAGAPAGPIDLPANTEVHLAAGGNYLVLVGLDRDIGNGFPVPISLDFEDAAHTHYRLDVTAQARGNIFPPGPPPPPLSPARSRY